MRTPGQRRAPDPALRDGLCAFLDGARPVQGVPVSREVGQVVPEEHRAAALGLHLEDGGVVAVRAHVRLLLDVVVQLR